MIICSFLMPLALLDHIHLQPYHWNYVASKCSYKLVICQHCVHTSRIKILVKSVRVGACLLSTNCFAHKTLYVHSFHHFPSAALHHGKYQGTCRWYVIQVSLTFQLFSFFSLQKIPLRGTRCMGSWPSSIHLSIQTLLSNNVPFKL